MSDHNIKTFALATAIVIAPYILIHKAPEALRKLFGGNNAKTH